jgi:16S rRNA (uracil1498-N3)-methyltransferase
MAKFNESAEIAASAMSERFFIAPPIAGDRALLTGDEARHLIAVMRGKVGDEINVFDGSGAEFAARITAIGKQAVELAIIERRELSRELDFALTLAVALPKGDRQKWLVEKATELGVTRIIPLVTERGVAQPTAAALDRLQRSVIEASKQCGRNRLMEISPPLSAADCFATAPAAAARLIAEPGGQPLAALAAGDGLEMIAAIGPEGGFSPDEIAAAKNAGWKAVSLGNRTLRIETAAIALAAWAALGRESTA